ncbi:PepSY-associated TM helix domain-containing protein [Fodinibius sediminis]|uniref:Uncharacterized iron-regulated membrane protein n=1 Tax=Fodinibius sediminis TaxID=1214077 RepID=A0A521BPG6_9BACT|nr:PepSY-associated TM helix domain-containing protein [Fodinibius sediminis]SMO49033.1 Uncharacterized iron-regulated membrane protein [Fodinibius sediminis]
MISVGKRPFKKIAGHIHLWLGLPTGLVVFVVAVTGCIYCFQEEIRSLYEDYQHVAPQEVSFIPPSEAHAIAEETMPGRHIHSVVYGAPNEALEVIFYEAEPEFYQKAYLNPYTGQLIKMVDLEAGFFHFILEGHIYLWMGEVGKKIVSYSTLIFLLILVSGLILWWPRNRKAARKRVRFRWSDRTRWKRKNYDLHNILGFYASLIALVVAITGLSIAFNWFSEGVHILTGGEKQTRFVLPENISSVQETGPSGKPIDIIWRQMMQEYPQAASVEMHYPPTEEYTIYAYVKLSKGTYWDSDFRYFDARTLEEVEPDHIYGKLEQASIADNIQRMNYDIHVGAIGGFAGKIIVFLSSLVVASLPVTGITIWWGRRRQAVRRKENRSASSAVSSRAA